MANNSEKSVSAIAWIWGSKSIGHGLVRMQARSSAHVTHDLWMQYVHQGLCIDLLHCSNERVDEDQGMRCAPQTSAKIG